MDWARGVDVGRGKERWAAGWAVILGAGLGLPFLFLFPLSFLLLNQTKFEFKYKFEFKPHSNN